MTVIEPRSRLAGLNVSELWAYRDLLSTLAQRDVKLRYRQTAVGVVWVVLQPILTSLIFSLVFGVLGHFKSDGQPYFVFAMAGNIGYTVFSSTLTKANISLVQNSNLVSKIYFPRLILPLSTAYSSLIDFGVSMGVMAILMLIFHVVPTIAILLLPFWVFLLLLMAIGIGLFTAALTVSYRDVQYITPVMLQMLTYASPVGYSIANPPRDVPHLARLFWHFNPLTGLLEGVRWSLLGVKSPAPSAFSVVYAVVVAMVLLITGVVSFRNMERRFADVI